MMDGLDGEIAIIKENDGSAGSREDPRMIGNGGPRGKRD